MARANVLFPHPPLPLITQTSPACNVHSRILRRRSRPIGIRASEKTIMLSSILIAHMGSPVFQYTFFHKKLLKNIFVLFSVFFGEGVV